MTIEITERQLEILLAIVQQYINTAMPVGSKSLAEEYKWGYSSATIRNEMNILEELSFIFQPHTSAGRVPQEPGYREFVNDIIRNLTTKPQKILPQLLSKVAYGSWDELLEELVTKLAKLLSNVVIISTVNGKIYHAGLTELLKQPEFLQTANVLPIIQLMEDRRDMFAFLQNLQFISAEKVAIYIGKEHIFQSLQNFTSLSSYFENQYSSMKGWVTIFGPTRLPYHKSLNLLHQLSSELEQLET
ncbi:MAG: hypothetical protein WCP97_02625 [bacterium]